MSHTLTRAGAFAAALVLAAPIAADDTVADDIVVNPVDDPDTWRAVEAERLVVMDTTKGRILVELLPEFAPAHAARIAELASSGFYDGIIFHRVVNGFVIQGGDPDGLGTGGSGQNIPAEFTVRRGADVPVVELRDERSNRGGFYRGAAVVTQSEALRALTSDGLVQSHLRHCPGAASMARSQSPNSGDSQFFLVRGDAQFLDEQYTAWGRVVSGLDAVYAMNIGVVMQTAGFEPDAMTTVRMASDLADDARPTAYVMREDSDAFAAAWAASGVGGAAPELCDFYTPGLVVEPDGTITASAGVPPGAPRTPQN